MLQTEAYLYDRKLQLQTFIVWNHLPLPTNISLGFNAMSVKNAVSVKYDQA
jgi:hypothetical protein